MRTLPACRYAATLLTFLLIVGTLNAADDVAGDTLRVVVTSEEADTPLPGLMVVLESAESDGIVSETTNNEGTVNLFVKRGKSYRLVVAGIDIRSKGQSLHQIPVSGSIAPIELSLSRKQLRESAEFLNARKKRENDLNSLRAKVDRAEMFKIVRGFLDSIMDKQILIGEQLEFTAVKNEKRLVLESDAEGMIYFPGHTLGLAAGDEYIIRSLNPETKKERYTGEGPNGGFIYGDERLPPDWQGGFKYTVLPIRTAKLLGVTFELNSSILKRSAQLDEDLACLAAMMKRKGYSIEMQGHTDNSTTLKDTLEAMQANVELSERRANALKEYFVAKFQVPVQNVKAVGYGQEFPIADNSTEAGREKNRRVVIKIRNRNKQ